MLALDGDQDGDNFISFVLRHLFSSSAAATVFKKNHTRQILTVAQTILRRKKNTEGIMPTPIDDSSRSKDTLIN